MTDRNFKGFGNMEEAFKGMIHGIKSKEDPAYDGSNPATPEQVLADLAKRGIVKEAKTEEPDKQEPKYRRAEKEDLTEELIASTVADHLDSELRGLKTKKEKIARLKETASAFEIVIDDPFTIEKYSQAFVRGIKDGSIAIEVPVEEPKATEPKKRKQAPSTKKPRDTQAVTKLLNDLGIDSSSSKAEAKSGKKTEKKEEQNVEIKGATPKRTEKLTDMLKRLETFRRNRAAGVPNSEIGTLHRLLDAYGEEAPEDILRWAFDTLYDKYKSATDQRRKENFLSLIRRHGQRFGVSLERKVVTKELSKEEILSGTDYLAMRELVDSDKLSMGELIALRNKAKEAKNQNLELAVLNKELEYIERDYAKITDPKRRAEIDTITAQINDRKEKLVRWQLLGKKNISPHERVELLKEEIVDLEQNLPRASKNPDRKKRIEERLARFRSEVTTLERTLNKQKERALANEKARVENNAGNPEPKESGALNVETKEDERIKEFMEFAITHYDNTAREVYASKGYSERDIALIMQMDKYLKAREGFINSQVDKFRKGEI